MPAAWPGAWIGVDLDGTLAHYDEWRGAGHVGEPIPAMVERIRAWLADGCEVRIFTARVGPQLYESNADVSRAAIEAFCLEHVGCILPVTHEKDMNTSEIWDDRAVGVVPNTGRRADA